MTQCTVMYIQLKIDAYVQVVAFIIVVIVAVVVLFPGIVYV